MAARSPSGGGVGSANAGIGARSWFIASIDRIRRDLPMTAGTLLAAVRDLSSSQLGGELEQQRLVPARGDELGAVRQRERRKAERRRRDGEPVTPPLGADGVHPTEVVADGPGRLGG